MSAYPTAETKTVTKIKEPPLFKVIYLNDDKTTMEFVIASLVGIFNHKHEDAHRLTMEIHEEGSAVVAVLPHEIAEQKGLEVITVARDNGFPLKVKVEEDN